MSLLICPECGYKISSTAISCPKCGFVGDDRNLPICQQCSCEPVPKFEIILNKWDINQLSEIDNKKIYENFGRWEKIQLLLPDIADVIRSMARSETILVADMDAYVQKLIKQGIYRFNIDKQGRMLPTIRDSSKIVGQVRLKEMSLSPEFKQTFNSLSTHILLTQVLNEVQELKNSICSLHIELQNDRLAQADSAWNKLEQAYKTQDMELRNERLNAAVFAAIDAKNSLIKSFLLSMIKLREKNFKKSVKSIMGNDDEQNADEAFELLGSIINMVQVECRGNASLGEYEACKQSLQCFKTFIDKNGLNNRDTILLLNERTRSGKNGFVDEFMRLVKNIERFDFQQDLEGSWEKLFLMEGEDETEK